MELRDAMRTTAAIREFTDDPVRDEELFEVLDTARFAPSGGNRQGWRVVIVKDPNVRRHLRDLYLPPWYDYLAQARSGLVSWAAIADPDAERVALRNADAIAEASAAGSGGFAEHLDEV